MDSEPQWRIVSFFDYFRARLANVRKLGELARVANVQSAVGTLVPEQHVILAAGLDALAKYWAEAYRPDLTKKKDRERFGEFLLAHADPDFFSRVSGPDLILRARAPKFALEIKAQEALQTVVGRHALDAQILDWRTDRKLDEVVADPRIIGAKIQPDWLQRSRYGEFLYREYRCCWVHEYRSSPQLGSEFPGEEGSEPYYQNHIRRGSSNVRTDDHLVLPIDHRLTLPWMYLAAIFERALNSFEAQCLTDKRDPAP